MWSCCIRLNGWGYTEVIGEANCVPLGDTFIERISETIAMSINQGLQNKGFDENLFSWKSAIDTIVGSIEE